MKESYALRIYDQPLISFSLTGSGTDYAAEITPVYDPAELYTPGHKISGENILRRIDRRAIQANKPLQMRLHERDAALAA